MKYVVNHETLGEITYDENFWTGKKKLYINGDELRKMGRNIFQTLDGKTAVLKGSYFTGLKLLIDSESIAFGVACKWYEYVLSILPFILIMIWGNSLKLCEIFPVVGGAIGGGISALCGFTNLYFIHGTKNILFKILISLATLLITVLICYLIALLILAII